jgi:hypothetical protein
MDPAQVLKTIRDQKLLIHLLGESLVDIWHYGYLGRPCQERPDIQRFHTWSTETMEGGAANVRVSLAAVTRMAVSHITTPPGILKTRFWDKKADQLIFRHDMDRQSAPCFAPEDLREPLVIADYGKAFLNWDMFAAISGKCKNVVFSPHLVNCEKRQRHIPIPEGMRDWLWIVNSEELAALGEVSLPHLVVTQADKPVVVWTSPQEYKLVITENVIVPHAVGIGDVFLAALAPAYFAGVELLEAVEFAGWVATRVLKAGRKGTCHIEEDDLAQVQEAACEDDGHRTGTSEVET